MYRKSTALTPVTPEAAALTLFARTVALNAAVVWTQSLTILLLTLKSLLHH